MAFVTNKNLETEIVVQRLRKAANLIAEANYLVQSSFETSENLYNFCSDLDDIAANIDVLADDIICKNHDTLVNDVKTSEV